MVPLLFRMLCVLICVRVLCPPDVCLCASSAVPARALAFLFQTGKDVPPPPHEHDDDHDAGCPCSPLDTGLGLRPSHVQHAIAFVVPSLDATKTLLLSVSYQTQPVPLAWPSDAYLYLTQCCILI
jgi:hypothetical protein